MPTSAPILNFTAANGVPFAARVVFTGDKYGVGDSLVNEDKPLLEFYDTRHTPTKFGQFVSRYFIETLTDSPIGTGINLQGGVESWQIDGENLKKAIDWATKQIGEKIMAKQKYIVDSSADIEGVEDQDILNYFIGQYDEVFEVPTQDITQANNIGYSPLALQNKTDFDNAFKEAVAKGFAGTLDNFCELAMTFGADSKNGDLNDFVESVTKPTIGSVQSQFNDAAKELITTQKDFAEGKISSFEHSRKREAALAKGLTAIALNYGVVLQQPLQIDSNGEFSIVAVKEGQDPRYGCGQFGEKFAAALGKNWRSGINTADFNMLPENGWCRLNHFEAEKIVLAESKLQSINERVGQTEYQGWTNSATYLANLYLSNEREPYEKITEAIKAGADFDAAAFSKLVTDNCGLIVVCNVNDRETELRGCGIVGNKLRLDPWAEGEINWGEIGTEWAANLGIRKADAEKQYIGPVVDVKANAIWQEVEPGQVIVHDRKNLQALPEEVNDPYYRQKSPDDRLTPWANSWNITYKDAQPGTITPAGVILLDRQQMENRESITPNPFVGKIVSETNSNYVQDIGRNTFVSHPKAITGALTIGKAYTIKHRDGKAQVTENVKSKGVAQER